MKQIRLDSRCAPKHPERLCQHQHQHQHSRHSSWEMEMASPEIPALCLRQWRALARARHELRCRRAELEVLQAELKKREELLLLVDVGRGSQEQDANGQHTRACKCETMLSTSGQGVYVKEHAVVHIDRPESSSSQFTEAISSPLTSHPSDSEPNDFPLDPITATVPDASSPSPAQQLDNGRPSASLFSGSTFVAIVVLIALPAAIVVGVFFLRKKKRRRS